MRRALLLFATCALAGTGTVAPASGQCPDGDGTLPGSSDSVTTVGTSDARPYTTIYIDDRDFLDMDEDDNAGGIWIYIESNGEAGLQRGGGHVSGMDYFPPHVYIPPTQVLPPNPGGLPILPNGLTLFPDGFGGSTGVPIFWWYDSCKTDETGTVWTGEADSILF